LRIVKVDSAAEVGDDPGVIYLKDLANADPAEIPYGQVSAKAGKAAYEYIEAAIKLAMKREAVAVVTGPLHKEALNLGGYHYSGHTEIFATLTQTKDYCMMLAEGNFRVLHVSTHVSLREACDRAKKDRIYRVIKLAQEAGRRMGIENPKIGVAGLNPHSGEGGLFGREEIEEITPAIEMARAEGIAVDGPVPPDTVYVKAVSGQYDFVISMYHDQGHIPLKLVGFKRDPETGRWTSVAGVNVTLGLPVIRTSVDHGTAFGKAGKGTANAQSMVDAMKMAVQMAGI
jgi:4-hydroxythreonine-4-phosphate dehydrogenase